METKVESIGTTGANSIEVPDIKANEIEYISEIGKGCFGVVHKGKCRGKVVAVKTLHQQEVSDVEEFKKEIQFLTHLRHPNIILFMGACTEPGKLAIVTEFLPGGDVHNVIHKGKKLSLLKILFMARDVAMGMNWLHLSKPPIIHRDLKPTNLLVDENFRVKICDFGLSAWQLNKTLQDPGVAPGTPLWMSPEVLQGKPLSEKADVYSYAIVLWEMLTRKEPFEHHTEYEEFVEAVCESGERPEIPQDMHPLLQALLRDSWQPTQKSRPSFDEIISRIDTAILETTIFADTGRTIWKRLYNEKEGNIGLSVSWAKFSTALYQHLGATVPKGGDTVSKALELLLTENGEVTLEKFGLFSHWFHPIDKSLINRIQDLISNSYFHGDISREFSENILRSYKRGYFLIRLSTTDPHQTPFTISKAKGKGSSLHQRVWVKEDRKAYYVEIKEKNSTKKVKVEVEGFVTKLLNDKRVKKGLGLKEPCPGSKFMKLDGITANPYVGEEDDDDDD